MYESISKNNELENEMTLDMSYFWYSDVGLDTFYIYQWRKLAKMKTKVNPRVQLWEDLTSFITTATADQAWVLLMLDANADITDLEFSSSLVECGPQDLHDDCDIVPPPKKYYKGKED